MAWERAKRQNSRKRDDYRRFFQFLVPIKHFFPANRGEAPGFPNEKRREERRILKKAIGDLR
jgi:hypothetical protein